MMSETNECNNIIDNLVKYHRLLEKLHSKNAQYQLYIHPNEYT